MNAAPPATGAEPDSAAVGTDEKPIHILWINAGLSCDGDSVALTAAMQPSIEEIALGA
ncbi:hydrogenase expression protein HypE, partial [Streptomyces sp. NPDC005047]